MGVCISLHKHVQASKALQKSKGLSFQASCSRDCETTPRAQGLSWDGLKETSHHHGFYLTHQCKLYSVCAYMGVSVYAAQNHFSFLLTTYRNTDLLHAR